MFNVHPRQFAYACGIPLGQRGKPPQRNCLAMFNVQCSMFGHSRKRWVKHEQNPSFELISLIEFISRLSIAHSAKLL